MYQKLKAEIKKELMEEFISPILLEIKDSEGEYKTAFIKSVLEAVAEKSLYRFNSKSFLNQIS